MALPLAFIGSESMAEFGRNCLTVVGAFLAGYVVGAIGCWAVDRWVFAKRSPDAAKKAISIIVGIVVAALVAFIVFGPGGGKGWFGGGEGTGSGSNASPDDTGDAKQKPNTTPPEANPPKVDAPTPPELKSDDPRARVTFLGGDAVSGDRFYLIDDDPTPKSFADLKSIVTKKRESAGKPLTLVVLFPTDPRQRIDPNSINVGQVTSWAEAQGIGVYKPGKP